MEERSLRDVVELEGRGEPFAETWDEADARTHCAMLTRFVYRKARKMLREGGEDQKVEAVTLMHAFIGAMNNLVATAGVEDLPLMMLALHNIASAYAALGDTHMQNTQNEEIWDMVWDAPPRILETEDVRFVRSKVYWGLFENSPEFFSQSTIATWESQVNLLEADRYPDFPGRALRLARKFVELGEPLKAIALLTRAVACPFGKVDQIREAQAYRTKLEKTLPPEPEEG